MRHRVSLATYHRPVRSINTMRRDALFAGGDLRTRLPVGIQEIKNEIQSFDPDRLLGTDPSELADYLVSKGTLEVPRLLKDRIYLDDPRSRSTSPTIGTG
jgi:hypothetical protein